MHTTENVYDAYRYSDVMQIDILGNNTIENQQKTPKLPIWLLQIG